MEQKNYWCPMHPEVQSDDPNAICTKCGTMKLVPREQTNHPIVKQKVTLKQLTPLLSIFVVVITVTLLLNYLIFEPSPATGMRVFMGVFFVVFGGFKVMRLKGFANAYPDYDLVAQHSKLYAWVYPFIELALGILFLANLWIISANIITIVIMSIGALGVYLKLRKGEEIICACLGTVFKVPMTWVTLMEDLVMVGMAIVMLVYPTI